MATRRKEITAGPSKWDLVLSLAEGKKVEITLEDWGRLGICIMSVRREDGSGESWNITGHLIDDDAIPGYWPCRGHYSTKHRSGFLEVHEYVSLPATPAKGNS
jgi:hypothetical protein